MYNNINVIYYENNKTITLITEYFIAIRGSTF